MNFLMVAMRPRAVQFVSHLPCKQWMHVSAHCESFFRKRKHSRGLRQPAAAVVQAAGCSSPEEHDPKSALSAFGGGWCGCSRGWLLKWVLSAGLIFAHIFSGNALYSHSLLSLIRSRDCERHGGRQASLGPNPASRRVSPGLETTEQTKQLTWPHPASRRWTAGLTTRHGTV
jgi:hypothetical protein